MRKNDKKQFAPPVVGGTSLLVAFAVLCFTVFALLSLSTVQADKNISDAAARSTSEYYAADCEAQTLLARLRNGEMPEGVTKEGSIYKYECPVSDTQTLHVTVRIENGDYSILQWETAASAQWSGDENIKVWEGTE